MIIYSRHFKQVEFFFFSIWCTFIQCHRIIIILLLLLFLLLKQPHWLSPGLPQYVTVRTHMPSSSHIHGLVAKYEQWNGKPRLTCDSVWHNLQTLLWIYTPGHASVVGNDQVDRLAGKASGLCLRRSEVYRSLRHYPQEQSQGHHTIHCLEEKGIQRQRA